MPSTQSKCPKMTFIAPQSIMLQIQTCYHSQSNVSLKTKSNTIFRGQAWVRPPANAGSRALFYPISIMPQISTEDSGIFYLIKNAKTNIAGYHLVSRHVISATSDVQCVCIDPPKGASYYSKIMFQLQICHHIYLNVS